MYIISNTFLFLCAMFSTEMLCLLQKQNLSTHEKELEKKRSEIEQMERDNLGPRVWTMQGEVRWSSLLSEICVVHVYRSDYWDMEIF